MKLFSYSIGLALLVSIGMWTVPSIAERNKAIPLGDQNEEDLSFASFYQRILTPPNPMGEGPPCLTYGCADPTWTSGTYLIYLYDCNVSSCFVEVQISTRYCDGICDIYIAGWDKPISATCDAGCVTHEKVAEVAIAYAIKFLAPNDLCAVENHECEDNYRVSMGSCGEHLYSGTYTNGNGQQWVRDLGWRPCDENICCIARYEVCRVDDEYTATQVEGDEGPWAPCVHPCTNVCDDLPETVPPYRDEV